MAKTLFKKIQLAAAEKDIFTIVIIDLLLPDMKGMFLGKMIKKDPFMADSRLVLLTSTSAHVKWATYEAVGFDTSLAPFKQLLLYECMAQYISTKKQDFVESTETTIDVGFGPQTNKKKARILLVEDDQINQKVALAFLDKFGFQKVDSVENGKEAMKALNSQIYDLVLMDCQMPEMDGYEATREIRKADNIFAKVPIVAMTGNVLPEDCQQCLDAGMNDFVGKPFDPLHLREVIEKWLL